MKRGRFGLPRPLGLGPLAPGGMLHNQPENADEMLEEITEIAEEEDINLKTESKEEIETVTQILAQRVFPESKRRQSRFIDCTTSEWGDNWADGLLSTTQEGDDLPLEVLSMEASGCRGMVQANTLDI